jgi:murein DD-endopeptidase MepM/ murein hydrolase activator NlpD
VTTRLLALLLCLIGGAAEAETRLSGRAIQGGLLVGRTDPGARVTLDGRSIRVSPEGVFALGFGRDAKAKAELEIRAPGGQLETRTLTIEKRRYHVQRIDGLEEAKVTPPPEVVERIRSETEAILAARRTDSAEALFAGGFVWPTKGPISGVFGSQRILNGQPRAPHYGVDVAAPVGTPILAPAAGTVALAHADLYFTGGTVILDHGHGVSGVFAHMDKVEVRTGQRVRQGERLGTVGKTGRVTGAHLHWGMSWFDERLDPALLVPPMPE